MSVLLPTPRNYFPVVFRLTEDHVHVAGIPFQPSKPGHIAIYTQQRYDEMPWDDFATLRVADYSDETDAMLADMRCIYEPLGHKSANIISTRVTVPTNWRRIAWGELSEADKLIWGERATNVRQTKPTRWSRGYIVIVAEMMCAARTFMTDEHYTVYINLWADLIATGNPRFQRERFISDCWAKAPNFK